MEHERRFSSGVMTEERDSLVVQALRAAGRPRQARQRAERFHREHPGSILAPVVIEDAPEAGAED
jgi:hypothetical protein